MKTLQNTPLLLAALTLACSGEELKEPLEDSTEYYEGTGDGIFLANSFVLSSNLIARRNLQPSLNAFNEQFIDLSDNETFDLVAEVDIASNTFTFAYTDGSYQGSGTLYGEAWNWHAWESTAIAPDNSRVVSVDTKDENGIVANKTGYNENGEEEWTMVETLTPITKEEWQTLLESP